MIWQVLAWITENKELLAIIFTAIGLLVKQRYDNNKHRLEREASRREATEARETFERDEKAKREAHQQEMEKRSADEISKQREWFQTRISYLSGQVETLDRKNDEQLEKIGQLTIENGLHKGTIESLKTQMNDMKTQLSELKQELRHYQTENGQLIDENTRLSESLHEEKERNKAAQLLNIQHLQVIRSLNKKIDECDTLIRAHESTIASQADIIKRSKEDTNQVIPMLDDNGNPVPNNGNPADDSSNDNDNNQERKIS